MLRTGTMARSADEPDRAAKRRHVEVPLHTVDMIATDQTRHRDGGTQLVVRGGKQVQVWGRSEINRQFVGKKLAIATCVY